MRQPGKGDVGRASAAFTAAQFSLPPTPMAQCVAANAPAMSSQPLPTSITLSKLHSLLSPANLIVTLQNPMTDHD